MLVKFISFTAWALTYSRLVGDHFNQHTHTHARACALTHSSVFKLTSEQLLLFCADRWNDDIVKLYTTMQHVLANYTWKKKTSQG